MLLDRIIVDSESKINTAIRVLLDSNAVGMYPLSLTLEEISEANFSIAMELMSMFSSVDERSPERVWCDVVKILRLLPWPVDHELYTPSSKPSRMALAVHHFFGGLPGMHIDILRSMVDDGKTWEEISKEACLMVDSLV